MGAWVNYNNYIVDGQSRDRHKPQKTRFPQEKVPILLRRRIVKKCMRTQPNARAEELVAENKHPIVSDKKARREAKKAEIKRQKKADKQSRKDAHMDLEAEG
jgi:hypothetical protein